MIETSNQQIDPKFLFYMIGKAEVEKELMRQRIQMLEGKMKEEAKKES